MDANEALERRIDELCRENERLRGTMESLIGRSFKTADKLDCLNAENERLRQASEYEKMEAFVRLLAKIEALKLLCRDMLTCIKHACMCEFCPLFASEEDMSERRCIADMNARIRDLDVL